MDREFIAGQTLDIGRDRRSRIQGGALVLRGRRAFLYSWPEDDVLVLPPTSVSLLRDETRPYFLWWTDVTVGRFRELLRSSDPDERAYWLGALLREANSRDVWIFATPDDIRRDWPHLIRHLGRSKSMWAWLLDLENIPWPPVEAGRV